MTVLLTAIWPSFANIPNRIPEDQGITTAGMIGFLLYFLLQLPFLCIPYTKVRQYQGHSSMSALTHLDPILLRFQECYCADGLPGCFW
jgi:NCS1 family nucleobase:cation symporter-1